MTLKLNAKIVRGGKVVSESNPVVEETGKHEWTDAEDKICSRECIVEYVIDKKTTPIGDMVSRLSRKLPGLKKSSIKDKISNIKAIFDVLGVENTLRCGKLVNYSDQNLAAVKWILNYRNIPFRE